MWLRTLRLKNFRSCWDASLTLSEHLTLLIGENDGGKSNILDSLRLCIPPASDRASIWFDPHRDLSFGGSPGEVIRVRREFVELTTEEDGIFTPNLSDASRDLIYTTILQTDESLPRRNRISHSVGDVEAPDPEPENRGRIAHVYLPALRDATRALDSADGSRLADIFRLIASPGEIDAFEKAANESLGALARDDAAVKVRDSVQTHLTSVTQPVRHRVVDVMHERQSLRRLVRSLRLHMAAEGLTPADLGGSGLGYANLLYIATVVLELERARGFDLLLLLVEEPEAHLHPQLQTVLLRYLEEQAVTSASGGPEAEAPAGRIQVIATSHSPHLASAVSTRNIVVVRGSERVLPPPEGEQQGVALKHTETSCVSLAKLDLNENDRRKIDRYLHATRAALLFARQVVLVEGIAEAVLLRTLAERIVYPLSKDPENTNAGINNRQAREQFRAISILPIDGVDFMPYLNMLLGGSSAIVDRIVVITDGDRGQGDRRRQRIESSFPVHVGSGRLSVKVGATTLEAELYGPPENEPLLKAAFEQQHPRSKEKWDAIASNETDPEARALAFSKALKDKALDLGKGDFAHVVADLLTNADAAASFKIPNYLLEGISAAVILDEGSNGDPV